MIKFKVAKRPEGFEEWAKRTTRYDEIWTALKDLNGTSTIVVSKELIKAKSFNTTVSTHARRNGFKATAVLKHGNWYVFKK